MVARKGGDEDGRDEGSWNCGGSEWSEYNGTAPVRIVSWSRHIDLEKSSGSKCSTIPTGQPLSFIRHGFLQSTVPNSNLARRKSKIGWSLSSSMRPTRRTIRYHSLTRRQVVGIKNISYPFDAYFEEFKKSSTVDPVFIDEAEKVGLVVSTHMQLSKLSRLERCHRFNRTNSFSPSSLANVKESDLPDIRCCVICHKPIEDVDPLDLRILRGTPVTPSDATHFASKSYVRCANAACLSRTLSPPLPHSFPQNLCFHPERLLRRLQTSQGAIQGARQRTRQGRSQATGLRQRRRNAPASSLAPQRLRQRGGKARSSAASLALHTRAHLPRGRQR